MKNWLGMIIASIAIVTLTACSPIRLPEQNTYVINATPAHVITSRHRSGIILVALPESLPIYNTTQMAYSKYPYQIAYFSKNQWATTPPQMVLPLLVQTLQNTHAYKAVVTAPFLGTYHYLLTTQILDLRQTFTHHQARVKLSILAMLSGKMGARVIATKRFDVVLSMPCITPYYGVMMTNQAMEIALKRIAAFCVKHRGK